MALLLQRKKKTIYINSLSQQKFLSARKLSPHTAKTAAGEGTWKIPFFAPAPKTGGSLTLEASLAMTFFLLLTISVCQLFLVMQLQIRVQRALEQVSNEAAAYSYAANRLDIWQSDSWLLEKLQDYLMTELSKEALRLRFLSVAGEEYLDGSVAENGSAGFSFEESSLLTERHRLRLVVTYRISLPIFLPGADGIYCRQQSYRYAWLGDREPSDRAKQEEQVVYVTKDSEVYHLTLSCTHLKLSVHSVPYERLDQLRNDNGAKYYPCELCRPGAGGMVCITNDGNRYHGDRDCGGITRNATAIPISEIGDRRPCSRCGAQQQAAGE